MHTKKLPKWAKLVTGIAVIGIAYAGFVSYVTYRENQNFKPYQQLAIELNNELGGGFKFTENKHCGLEGLSCPSLRLTKDTSYNHLVDSNKDMDMLKSYLLSINFSVTQSGKCGSDSDEGYCNFTVHSGTKKLTVSADFKRSGVGVDINSL